MNGASTEPCAKISSPPISTITMMIGSSHHFFRTRMKAHSSRINPVLLMRLSRSELAFQVAAAMRSVAIDPVAWPRRSHQWVAAQRAPEDPRRRQHQEVEQAHEDRRRNLRDRVRQ